MAAKCAGAVGLAGVPGGDIVGTSRSRATRVGRLAARRTAGFVWMRSRQFGRDHSTQQSLAEAFQIRSAEDIARELGGMRGAMTKIGQAISVAAHSLPEEARQALASLQADMPPMAPGLAERIIREDLGLAVEQLFLDWDCVPAAAASIGQVHRARLLDGSPVAVKVQYPGLENCLGADLRNATRIASLFAGIAFPGVAVPALIEELRFSLLEELDYRIEARRQHGFATRWAGHSDISVPRVFLEHSSKRVLVSGWVDGSDLATFAREGSIDARRRAGEALLDFALDSVFQYGEFQADPHPGNLKFSHTGAVTVLDFGLVRTLSVSDRKDFLALLDSVLEGDDASVAEAAIRVGLVRADSRTAPSEIASYLRRPFELFSSGERQCTEAWLSDVTRAMFNPHGPHAAVIANLSVPPNYFFVDRVTWGVMAVLARLRASSNWRTLLDMHRLQGASS